MLVKEAMKQAFVIEKDASLSEAAKMMGNKGIHSLIFVSGKKIKGILTERDVLKNFNKNVKVSQAMTKEVVTIDAEDELQNALELMNKHKVKRLPVLDNGELVGIISATHLLSFIDELEGEFFFN